MGFIKFYLLPGIVFYTVMAIKNRDSFKDASVRSVLRGLIGGILVWPLVAIILIYLNKNSILRLIGIKNEKQ